MNQLLSHPAIQKIAAVTSGTKFENQLYLVGGAVRDSMLGLPPKNDLDLVTELDATELADLLFQSGASTIKPQIFARFGTAMVQIEETQIELITARRESYASYSRKPHTEPATLLDDAYRRDFTVNTLLLNLHTGETVNLLGNAVADLEARVLRTPLEPAATFHDDPLRMLRAVRFKHQLGFEFAPGLAKALKQESHRLEIISQERIRDEFSKIITGPNPDVALEELREFGLLKTWASELETMVGVEQGKYHYADVWVHTLAVVKNAQTNDLTLALACLLHDIAKPLTKSIDEKGDIRFFDHEVVGANLAYELCTRWRYSQDMASEVRLLVRNHMRLNSMESVSTPAARRIVRDLGESLEAWLQLIHADASSLKSGVRKLDLVPIRKKLEETKVSAPVSKWQSPLNGDDITEILQIQPGPIIGEIKSHLENLVIEGKIDPEDKEAAKDALHKYLRNRPNHSGVDHQN